MALLSGVGGDPSFSSSPHGPGLDQADVAMADANPVPAAAAQQSALVLSLPPVDNPEGDPSPEVRRGTRTQPPRLTRHRTISPPFLAFPQEQAALGAAAADAYAERHPAVALPDTPSGSGIEVQAELVFCPWAVGLDPTDRPALGAAWKHLGLLEQEQAAYLLLRLLRGLEVDEKPRFDRARTGALAILSTTYRRLRAGEALRATPAEEDAEDEELDESAPSFLVPLVAQIASSIRAKAQGAVAEDAPPDEKILKSILGGLRSKRKPPPKESRPPAFTAQRVVPSPSVRAPPIVASLRVSQSLR